MSASRYTAAERGGGSGDTGRMRAAILNQIQSWHQNARWVDDDRADAVLSKVSEAPERFISPDPDANYREEASRIWAELKAEHGLRTENEAVDEWRDHEAAAERRAEQAEVIDYAGAAEDRAAARAAAPAVTAETVFGDRSTAAEADRYAGLTGALRLARDALAMEFEQGRRAAAGGN